MLEKFKRLIAGNKHKNSRSPNLDTIVMVESFVRENSGRYKKTQLFKKLPKQVMWNTFQTIIDYLEKSMKISSNSEGFITYEWDENLKKMKVELLDKV